MNFKRVRVLNRKSVDTQYVTSFNKGGAWKGVQAENKNYTTYANSTLLSVGVLHYSRNEIPKALVQALETQHPEVKKLDTIPVLLPEDEVSKVDLNGMPVTHYHTEEYASVNPDNFKEYLDGVALNVKYNAKKKTHVGDVAVYSKGLNNAIAKGANQLSIGYEMTLSVSKGQYKGEHYYMVQKDFDVDHIAAVPYGRAGDACQIPLVARAANGFIKSLNKKSRNSNKPPLKGAAKVNKKLKKKVRRLTLQNARLVASSNAKTKTANKKGEGSLSKVDLKKATEKALKTGKKAGIKVANAELKKLQSVTRAANKATGKDYTGLPINQVMIKAVKKITGVNAKNSSPVELGALFKVALKSAPSKHAGKKTSVIHMKTQNKGGKSMASIVNKAREANASWTEKKKSA